MQFNDGGGEVQGVARGCPQQHVSIASALVQGSEGSRPQSNSLDFEKLLIKGVTCSLRSDVNQSAFSLCKGVLY